MMCVAVFFSLAFLLYPATPYALHISPLPHRIDLRLSSTASPLTTAALLTEAGSEENDIVKIAALVSSIEKSKVNEDSGELAERRARLFGNYKVLQTFQPKNLGEKSNAAGGKWVRPNSLPSRLGLSVEGLYQNIVESQTPADPVAVNLVLLSFLFRLLTVAVVLRGDCDFLDDDEREEITKKRQVDGGGGLSDLCVRARFDSPLIRVCLFGWRGPGVTLRIGPSSRVILDASYVDDQLRIGKGASGVRFVLERVASGGDDVAAERWRRVVGSRLIIGKRGFVGILALASGLAVGAGRRWLGGAGILLAALTTASTGGII
eukprot:CAMPEP_0197559412 /NCGR_PEP_ID=MMETSP1320-20131121/21183_1 /TAXON_ID=91990 /ORGANISM="Bolidomonas sp., Strain RCC2347" /LENGTH=319 /DNA_ID=CAMNT_0043120847 /DNA_START=150 /DNA_END=1106 /DNA_ORIENTATION=-